MGRIVIDPITRIEGHLKVEVVVEDGEIKDARTSGVLFRGIEVILKGRDPRDAQRITQRVCGVCPASHSTASALCLDSAFGIDGSIPDNGRLIRNLILGSAHIADHILHFYLLTALDYVDVTQVTAYEGNDAALCTFKDFLQRGELGPFVPRYDGDYRFPTVISQQLVRHYIEALRMRRKAHEMCALFGGKMPHDMAIVPGGVTENATEDKVLSFMWRLSDLKDFIDNVYLPDVLALAEVYGDYLALGIGCCRLLSYGSYELDGREPDLTKRKRLFRQGTVDHSLKLSPLDISAVCEHVKYSWYVKSTTGRHPASGETQVEEHKEGAYSWIKSPRYEGQVYEVGPLARVMASYLGGDAETVSVVDPALARLKADLPAMFSVMGRHLTRACSCKVVADNMSAWLLQLKPGEPVYLEYEMPDRCVGMGLVEAARGALGHYIEINDRRIVNYQCVTPSTWNVSPRDDRDEPGPMEQALIGTKVKDEANPFEVVRIIRSFDPCLACAVHLITPSGRTMNEFRVA